MGIQTMGLQGSSGSSSNNGKHTLLQGPTRQNSIYSLTLDEVQNHLGDIGKPLSSMNLDELLKNVWTAEGGQSVALEDGAASENQTSLERQGSLSLNGALSKRTVNEVWRDIQQSKNGEQKRTQERQTTLGEMTLEDFLVQAGVVVESSPEKKGDNPGAGVDPTIGTQLPQQGQWMQYGQPQFSHPSQGMMGAYMPAQPLPPQMQMGTGPMMDLPYSDSQISLTSPLMETLSDPMYGGRKRVLPEDIIEKSVERRQKRMIKNRESAARSRARKQAYTNELEIKVSRLEEENERLKKRKELESMLPTAPPEPKFQLRRTSSAPY